MEKVLLLFLVAMFLLGCAEKQETTVIPEGMEVTRLADILENPAQYDARRVLLEGNVGLGCLTCPGDFPYQEGVNVVQMLTEGGRPRLSRGQPIRVYAEVKAGAERVVVSALSIEAR